MYILLLLARTIFRGALPIAHGIRNFIFEILKRCTAYLEVRRGPWLVHALPACLRRKRNVWMGIDAVVVHVWRGTFLTQTWPLFLRHVYRTDR